MKPTLLSLAVLLFAQWVVFMPTEVSAADETLPVFLCVGGSNMSGGRSKVEELPEELKGEQAKALFFDGTQWLPLSAEKMNKRGFGCEVSFAASMSEKLGRTIGIIKHSSHGTSLDTVWSPATPDSLYWEFIRKVEAARKARPITIVGVIMVQGSGDSKDQKKAEAYAANLQAWIQAARKDLQTPDLLFVCSRLRAGQPKDKFPFANLVRQAQEAGSEFVDCDALEVGDDEVHFTAKGQIDLGRLFADKLHAMMSRADGQR
ncbi:MAG: hypothetical protein RIS79_2616 [Verrucomicrobiota bacterium]